MCVCPGTMERTVSWVGFRITVKTCFNFSTIMIKVFKMQGLCYHIVSVNAEDVDECQEQICNNNGTCVNTHGSSYCSCVAGWMGNKCQTGLNYISSMRNKHFLQLAVRFS